jgi:TolB-like protein/DNA-binding winged helix-turn-helix (wHTH) protein/Tfp pilus assembly protein PilF
MPVSSPRPPVVRFGVFEVDLRSGELRRNGLKIKLQEQPFQILAMLLARPGEVVTREEIQKKLWSEDTFVDFEHSLATAVKKLREALGDSADSPRFVETLPRRGYRFIAPVEALTPSPSPGGRGWPRETGTGEGASWRRLGLVAISGGAVVAIVAVLLSLNIAGLRDRVLPAVGAVREPPLQIRSIAVLPLENLSRDPEQEYFADGMTEELITTLGKIGSLRVISRTTAMHFKGTKKTLPEIARELNVDAIVEGSVLRSGTRVRVTANLLHAPTDRHLWAESYERDLRDVLALQSELARAIAREVQVKLTPQEQTRLARARPVNPVAHEAYLRSSFYLDTWRTVGWKNVIEYLEKAARIDPTYAPPYARLAIAYSAFFGHPGIIPPGEAYPKARAAALKALELDETLAEAHAALSQIKLNFEWDWSGAEREAKRAVELDPNSVHAIRSYAAYLMYVGKTDDAIAQAKHASDLDPFGSPHLAWVYANSTRFDEGIAHVRKEMERRDHPLLPYFLTNLYVNKGMCAEALAAADKFNCGIDCAKQYALCGRRELAQKYARELEAASKREYVDPIHIAWVYVGLGDKEKALQWYEEGYRKRSTMMVYLKIDELVGRASATVNHAIYDDPRYQDLLRRMNFPK